MALVTMSHIGFENGISTTETDSYSRVPMGFHRLTRSNSRSQGFTLIELLVTVAIVGIVAVIAVPSMQNFVLNNRIRAQAAALTSSLAFARTEAITRGTRVVTCPRTASNDCDCSADQEEWESGWQVIVDINGDEICDSDDSLLEVHGPLDGSGTTLRGSANVKSKVVFLYDGSAQLGKLVLCDQRGASHARAIEVLATGRSRTYRPVDCGTGPDPSAASGSGTGIVIKPEETKEEAHLAFLDKHAVRSFKINKKNGKPIKPKKKSGETGGRWNNAFERGVYFDLLLDWQKSNGKKKKNQKRSKNNRDKHFRTTNTKDTAIVQEYIRLKEATGTPYIPK